MIQGAKNPNATPIMRTLHISAPAPCSIVRRIVAGRTRTLCDKISLGINLNVGSAGAVLSFELGFGPIVAMDRQIFESSK
jgi:hypothetical protein